MRYFSYIAEQSFKTDAEGRRVLLLGGPFFRPYVIIDQATESRLFKKLTWHYRIFLSTLIVGQTFLMPRIIQQPLRFFGFLAAIMAIQWLVLRITFFADLRKLRRASGRISLRTFYAETAERHSARGLVWGMVGSLAFVLAGIAVMLADREMVAVGATLSGMFVACAVAWGYMLRLKLAGGKQPG